MAGNPNCGKTTLFNALTGSNQRVGNWPGVTVERMEGTCRHGGREYRVIDLPGIYSFSTYSLDEKVAREFILLEKPDLVVNIIDASNLERNLYLTTQLVEIKAHVLVALNMMDIAKRNGVRIEVEHLSQHLDCPVVPVIANRKKGLEELLDKIGESLESSKVPRAHVAYDAVMEESLAVVCDAGAGYAEKNKVDKRWLAIKLFERDELAEKMTGGDLSELVKKESSKIKVHTGDDADIVIADGRYGFINGLAKDVVNRDAMLNKSLTDSIDKVVLNRFLGIPIFVLAMYLMFFITMRLGSPFIDFFEKICGTIFVEGGRYVLSGLGVPEFIIALLADGVGGGIQTVATFIPPITLIFLCLSVFEDSGYMARAAFVMDRLLRSIGLPGKAFIPMLVGFGCNVPGILATRTLESQRDRLLSILINPLMSCGARLPIYALFAAVFFRDSPALTLFSLYATGVLLAVLTGLLFGGTILKGEASAFVMELPPYHIPTVNGVLFHTWGRLKGFLYRAGKVIIIIVICLSFLNSIGTDWSFGNQDSSKSVLSALGRRFTPVFYPMGITEENWPTTVGLFTGIFAKEAVVGTINSLYMQMETCTDVDMEAADEFDFWGGVAEAFASIPKGFGGLSDSIQDPVGIGEVVHADVVVEDGMSETLGVDSRTFAAMRKNFPNKSAVFAYLLFVLIYAPCVAAIAAIYRETSFRWALFAVCYLTGLAWLVATTFYQVTRLSSSPGTAVLWIVLCVSVMGIFIRVLKGISRTR